MLFAGERAPSDLHCSGEKIILPNDILLDVFERQSLILAPKRGELRGIARAAHHLVTVFRNPSARVYPTTPEPRTPTFIAASTRSAG